MTLRVAYDATAVNVSTGGAARYVRSLGEALKRRYDVALVEFRAPGGRLVRAPRRVLCGVWREAVYYPVDLERRARQAKTQVLHCPAPLAPRRGSMPFVLTVHDLLPWRYPELFTRVNVAQHKAVVRAAIARADVVLAPSSHTAQELQEVLDVEPSHIHLASPGVSEIFRCRGDRVQRGDRSGTEPRFLLAVGTLEPRKNLPRLLSAWSLAYRQLGEGELVIVGGAGWRDADITHAIASTSAPVRVLGRVDDCDLADLYASARMLVFPSLYEGFGLPPVEAMASGCPVIASKGSSLDEVVGDAGITIDPLSIEDMRDAIVRVWGDAALRSEMVHRGWRRSALFTWDACAAQTALGYQLAVG